MSIVIAVATLDRVIVKSDGLERFAESKEVKSQNCKKFVYVNPNCIIGFTGLKHLCDLIIDEYLKRVRDANINVNDLTVSIISNQICMLAKNINHFNHLNENNAYVIAGIEDNKVVLYGFSNKNGYELINSSPSEGEPLKYLVLGSDIQNSCIPFSKFYDSKKSIESNINDYIRYISTVDPSVNDYIFTSKLKIE
jgi:hypothetical protein